MTAPASASSTARHYDIAARSTDIFGRVMCSARDHHYIVDGPVQNDCPGEAITPSEVFLSGVAACGVELMHFIAKSDDIPLQKVLINIRGTIDKANQPRAGVTTFNSVAIDVTLWGVTDAQAKSVVDGFKARCPLYGTVSVAIPDVQVRYSLGK
jgi:uncharacterized OsmC-like protein